MLRCLHVRMSLGEIDDVKLGRFLRPRVIDTWGDWGVAGPLPQRTSGRQLSRPGQLIPYSRAAVAPAMYIADGGAPITKKGASQLYARLPLEQPITIFKYHEFKRLSKGRLLSEPVCLLARKA